MIRTIIWFIYFWAYLLYTLPLLRKVKAHDRRNRIIERDEMTFNIVKKWAKSLVKLTGSEIKVIGEENIPKSGSVLFVSNHQGNFDIPILLGFINKPKGFIAKIELKNFPIVSSWMNYMKCIFMDRKDVRQSLRSINQGVGFLKEGYSLVVFPEGTRSKDGNLGDFKPGSLKLATKSGVPIVPITIKGSNNIMSKSGLIIKPAYVEVIISPPVSVDNLDTKDSKKLSETIRNIIAEKL